MPASQRHEDDARWKRTLLLCLHVRDSLGKCHLEERNPSLVQMTTRCTAQPRSTSIAMDLQPHVHDAHIVEHNFKNVEDALKMHLRCIFNVDDSARQLALLAANVVHEKDAVHSWCVERTWAPSTQPGQYVLRRGDVHAAIAVATPQKRWCLLHGLSCSRQQQQQQASHRKICDAHSSGARWITEL